MFQRILIYGFGLMGASLSLAIRKKNLCKKISSILRNQKSLEEIKTLHFQDEFLLEEDFLSKNLWNEFDFIILCLPVNTILQKIQIIPSSYNGIITDVASTKKEIIDLVEKKFPSSHNYVSSHPMTGSENSGAEFARDDLYENKVCILTFPKNCKSESKEKVQTFWNQLNCRTVEICAEDHDEILAYLSHTPHILSALMVNWSLQNEKVQSYTHSLSVPLIGGGFKDMSRIAGSNPEMWEAIIKTNSNYILESLKSYHLELKKIIDNLENPNFNDTFWKSYFKKAKENRSKLLKLDS